MGISNNVLSITQYTYLVTQYIHVLQLTQYTVFTCDCKINSNISQSKADSCILVILRPLAYSKSLVSYSHDKSRVSLMYTIFLRFVAIYRLGSLTENSIWYDTYLQAVIGMHTYGIKWKLQENIMNTSIHDQTQCQS